MAAALVDCVGYFSELSFAVRLRGLCLLAKLAFDLLWQIDILLSELAEELASSEAIRDLVVDLLAVSETAVCARVPVVVLLPTPHFGCSCS